MSRFFGDQPRGLSILFLTEMWERFGYYGMRALLILYMTKEFLFSDEKAYGIYGAFTAMVYVTPVLGGYLGDRLLGHRRALIWGASLLALGYFMLAIPAGEVEKNYFLFYASLSVIILGNGLFKPNSSSLVGALYPRGDKRIDTGYTLFYMGINLGSLLAPLLCGYVGEEYGWNYGFALTGVGLLAGLYLFIRSQAQLGEAGLLPSREEIAKKFTTQEFRVMGGIVLCIPLITWMFLSGVAAVVLNLTGLFALGLVGWIMWSSNLDERKKVMAIVLMMVFHTTFFACFEQAGSSLNLFADRVVTRDLSINLGFWQGSWLIPTTFFQAVNPIFILIFAPMLAGLWTKLGAINKEPSTALKFFVALLLTSFSFYLLVLGCSSAETTGHTSMTWLVMAYLFMTLGELCISPVGLAMTSRLAPERFVGLLMGIWLLSVAFSNYAAALLAKLASVETSVEASLTATAEIYGHAFATIGWIALGMAVLMLLIRPFVNKLMGTQDESIVPESKDIPYSQLFMPVIEEESDHPTTL